MQTLRSGSRALAGLLLLDLARSAPDHPEVLRCQGLWHAAGGEWQPAVEALSRSHALRPLDFPMLLQLAAAQNQADDADGARRSLADAESHARSAADWLALSLEFDRQGDLAEGHRCAQRALSLEPRHPVALLQRARCATALGLGEQAAADCRALIARGELVSRAWFMLADLKVVPLSADELAQLEALAAAPPATMPAEERLYLLFALGKALEDAGRHADAFAALQRANTAAQASRPWDAAAFARKAQSVQDAFAALPPPPTEGPGRAVIFLVGLPRSGTTLVEQILASHPQVEGASELPYLMHLIEEESHRRGRPFPEWVGVATDADWARLGAEYLRRSARWRASKPIATDKLPGNWLFVGAALRMLPGTRIIDCRRDPVETCWSCYKQLFGPGMEHHSYSFEGLAAHWRAYDSLARFWVARHPQAVRAQHYGALVAAAEAETRELLAFCGLPFDAACLSFHTTQRAIRTPSALQVRRPLRAASTPGAGYGPLLQPLRDSLAATDANSNGRGP